MFKLPYCNREYFLKSLDFFMKKEKKIVNRIAFPEDIPLILKMEESVFDDSWSETQLRSHMASGGIIYVSENCSDEIIAYCILRGICDEWEIYRIAVHPAYRRAGIAKKLLRYFLKNHEFSYETITIFLEVRKSNPARLFYESLNFCSYGERKSYYKDGEDCLLYKCDYTVFEV